MMGSMMRLAITLVMAAVIAGCSGSIGAGVMLPTAAPTATAAVVLTAPPVVIETPVPPPTPSGSHQFTPGDPIALTSNGNSWATVTITQVKEVAKYSGTYSSDTPAAGNVYIQAFVSYTALADGVTYNSFDWQVFVGGVAVNTFTVVLYGPTPQLGSGTLPNGRKAEGWLVYEIPKTGMVLLSYASRSGAPVFEVVLRAS